MLGYIRNRIFITLAILIFAGVFIGGLHNNAVESGKSFFLQDVISTILVPVNYTTSRIGAVSEWFGRVGRSRSAILKENTNLRAKVLKLTAENAKLRECMEENSELRKELALQQSIPYSMISAEVVSRKESNFFDTITVNQGKQAGVKKGLAVINHLGLVGQVLETNKYTSKIVTLADPDSAVGGIVQRSRAAGMIRGQGTEYLALEYLPKDADIKQSDIIVSSGMGGVIPKGLVIGRVVRVLRDDTSGTTSALVRPSVKPDQVRYIFILKPGQVHN